MVEPRVPPTGEREGAGRDLERTVRLSYMFSWPRDTGEMGLTLGKRAPTFAIGANALCAPVMALWVRIAVEQK